MTERLACPPVPGPLESYAVQFDELFTNLAQRRGFREYLQGLLVPRDRNKTLTGLVGTEPVVGADAAPVQRLQFFLSESTWDPNIVNDRRLELLLSDPATRPHERGVLVVDETGDRKDGNKTDHVARQYLGSIGKVDNGIVAVSTLFADERIYYPLHVTPYTPAERLPQGRADPTFQTKPQIALDLIEKAVGLGLAFRAIVADCLYGDNRAFESALVSAGLPYVVALKPSKSIWAREDDPHTPEETARTLRWNGPDHPGDWTRVVRCFRDGHEETWWATDLTFGGYGPDRPRRLVVATNDPATLPTLSTWYLATNLPRPDSPQVAESESEPADLTEVVRLYGLRNWVEQSYKQVKGELGWADFMVRSDLAIRRHWELVCCAFSFCWYDWFGRKPDSGPSGEAVSSAPPTVDSTSDTTDATEDEPWRWGKNQGQTREAAKGRTTLRQLADGGATGSRLAGSVDYPLALVESLVQLSSATRTPGTPQLGRLRATPQPVSANLTKYR